MDRHKLEQLRQQRLAQVRTHTQLQEQAAHEQEEIARARQQVAALEQYVNVAMTKEARSRYGNIKAVDPEHAIRVLVVLARMLQQKQEMVTDTLLKEVLRRLTPEQRPTTIKRV